MSETGHRWLWAVLCVALVSLPFLGVKFIPSTDLPQHLGQLRLFSQAWSDPEAGLKIQWWTPYGLVYAFLALPWVVLPPVLAGKVAVWLLTVLQVGLVHLVAARWERPVSGAVFACAFLFNNQFYWGFLNFIFGGVVFFGWYALTRRSAPAGRPPWRTAALFLVTAGVLYLAHALWFAFGVLWLVVEAWLSRRDRREVAWRLAGVAPVGLVATHWFLYLRASSFTGPPIWTPGSWLRLVDRWFVVDSLGGLRHPIEAIVVFGAVLWILAALLAGRRRPALGCERHLGALALLLLTLYLVLPNQFSNTIRFHARWLPYAFVFGLLAVGELPLRRLFRKTLAVVLLGTLMVVSTAYWRHFERVELAGLEASLEALPPSPRVLGLAYIAGSRLLLGRPFIQTYAWSYVVHGGDINFSFGYFAPSLVVWEDPTRVRWTWGLEWYPKAIRRRDLAHFDFVLVGGDEEAQEVIGALSELEPVVEEGLWWLYRVVEPAPSPPEGLAAAPAEP